MGYHHGHGDKWLSGRPLIVYSVIINAIFKTPHLIISEEGRFLTMKAIYRLGQQLLIFPFPGIMTIGIDMHWFQK